MKTHELIELALLDAFGLLDDSEREQFERAYAIATPAVQAQVRREQTRFVQMESFLPDVEAPDDLRARVLARVRDAIAAQDVAATGAVMASIRHDAGRAMPPITSSRRVSVAWRAGALGCAAAAIVFAVTTIQMRVRYDQLARTMQNDELLSQMLETYGPNHLRGMLFDGKTERVVFTSTDAAVPGEASIWMNPDWDSSRLFCLNLPAVGSQYKLAVVDASGAIVSVVAEFGSNGALLAHDVPSVPRSGGLAIVGPGSKGQNSTLMVATAKRPNA